LIFSDPQPVPENIEDHYDLPAEDYWTNGDLAFSRGYYSSEIAAAKRLLPFAPGMKALDIGAGTGRGMKALELAGFDTWGIEPSKPFRDWAVSGNAVDPARIAHGVVEDARYAEESFDFINLGAVLEHFYSPSDVLRRSLAWLKPGGLLYAEVPSASWVIPRLINLYYRLRGVNYVTNLSPMHAPFHLYEFDIRSFLRHGAEAGYDVVEHHISVCEIINVPRVLHPLFQWGMERTGTGMQLHIWLRKR
jgi:SAM-dependent methyltransferase